MIVTLRTRYRAAYWRPHRDHLIAEDGLPPSHAWRSPAPAPGTNDDLEVWLSLRPRNSLGRAIRLAACFGARLCWAGAGRREGGWRVWSDGKWLTRNDSKLHVRQFVIATVAALEYELTALRRADLAEAARLVPGIEEATRRAVRREMSACPGEDRDEVKLQNAYLKQLVLGCR